jgi:hypothetical protein
MTLALLVCLLTFQPAQPANVPANAPVAPPPTTPAAAATVPIGEPVALRGVPLAKAAEPTERAVAVSPIGVVLVTREETIAGPRDLAKLVGLDRVRSVEGSLAGAWKSVEADAADAWRARVRLERGDFVGAEPLFERLFAVYSGKSGPTATAVCAGLLRCRADRGSQAGAVEAWLSWLDAAYGTLGEIGLPADSTIGTNTPLTWDRSDVGLADVLIEGGPLARPLPPTWLPVASTKAFASGTMPEDGVGMASTLRRLYLAAAMQEAGDPDAVKLAWKPGEDALSNASIRLVYDIVRSRVSSQSERVTARAALRSRLDDARPQWSDAWVRVAIGRSLLMESDAEERRKGVVQLLYLPARGGAEDVYLTGVALAEAAVALEAIGSHDASEKVVREFVARVPGHPASEWPAMAALMERAERTTHKSESQ